MNERVLGIDESQGEIRITNGCKYLEFILLDHGTTEKESTNRLGQMRNCIKQIKPGV